MIDERIAVSMRHYLHKTLAMIMFAATIGIAREGDVNTQTSTNEWHLPTVKRSTEAQVEYTEIEAKISVRGTQYRIRVPENWHGTLVSDLDYYGNADSPKALYLLEHGYALSGTKRRPNRMKHYDPAHEIHDLISVLDIFEATFGKPKHTIQWGCSGGGTITLAMAEIHPDRIDGAIAACGATSRWMANTHLDGLFVLKTLIAPDLPIVDLPLYGPEIQKIGVSWQKAIKGAQQTPEGRARIALAMTIGQWPAWGGAWKTPVPEPEPRDVRALQASMYESLIVLIPCKRTFGTTMLEQAGRGQLRSNVGVDYNAFFQNGNPHSKKAVKTLYQEAGLNLAEDLSTINAFPRIEPDRVAVKYWSLPGRTHVGEPKVPLLRIHTSGDGLVYPSMAQGYEELVHEKGYSKFYRSAWVRRWGHCSFSLAEWLAALETMKQHIETGVWPDTSPKAMNKRGQSLVPDSDVRFFKHQPVKKYNRTWCPGVEEFVGN